MSSKFNMKGFMSKSRPASGKLGGTKGKGKKESGGSILKDSPFKTYKQSAKGSTSKLPKAARKR